MDYDLNNLLRPEYRELIVEDAINCLLKGGATIEMAHSMLIILKEHYKEDYTNEDLERQVLRIHECMMQDGEYSQRRNFQNEVTAAVTFRGKGSITLSDIYTDLKVIEAKDKP
jgi:deoxyhypusine synthase